VCVGLFIINCVLVGVTLYCVWVKDQWIQILQGRSIQSDVLNAIAGTRHPECTLDAIKYAGEIGRLDLVTLCFGGFGLFLAGIAICGFWLIRRESISAAEDEARHVIQDIGPEHVNAYIDRNPDIISTSVKEWLQSHVLEVASLVSELNSRLGTTDEPIGDEVAKSVEADTGEDK
jgi:hypothetical protein